MDIKRIRNALHEDGGAVAAGTSSTPANAGVGSNTQGISPFKAKMGSWRRRQDEEVDPQEPGVVQSTQTPSTAQLINPWAGKLSEVTHEVVNLFDEERMSYKDTRLSPFGGLQLEDFEVGIENIYKNLSKVIHYNLMNTTDDSNRDKHRLKTKYQILKKQALYQIESSIDAIENNTALLLEDDLNLGDIFFVMCLVNAYSSDEDYDPIKYANEQADRLLDVAKNDSLELAKYIHEKLIPSLKPNKSTKLGISYETHEAINRENWGEALVWNKLRKTIELMKPENDTNDYDVEVPNTDDTDDNNV
jgi:hypothetical protein